MTLTPDRFKCPCGYSTDMEHLWRGHLEVCDALRQKVLNDEAKNPLQYLFLSFVSDHIFLGGIIVKTHGLAHAIRDTHRMGINPGGEVLATVITDDMVPDESFMNRLLTRAEIEALWPNSKQAVN